MLVVCPKCFTQYVVSDEIRIKKGQKFHCSACQNYFVLTDSVQQNESEDTDIIPTVSSVMEAVNQPTLPAMGVSVCPTTERVNQITIGKSSDELLNSVSPKEQFADTVTREPRFEEPLNLLANERPNPNIRLDAIPEAFQPVKQTPKKTSFLGTLFWLSVVAGICATAYMRKDYLIEQLDAFILNQLDKGNISSVSTPIQPAPKKSVPQKKDVKKENIVSAGIKSQVNESDKQVKSSVDVQEKEVSVQTIEQKKQSIEKVSQKTVSDIKKLQTNTVQPMNKNVKKEKPVVQKEQIKTSEPPVQQEVDVQEVKEVISPVSTEIIPVLTHDENVVEQMKTIQSTVIEQSEIKQVESEFPTLSGQLDSVALTNQIAQELPNVDVTQVNLDTPVVSQPEIVREQAVIPETFASLAEQSAETVHSATNVLDIRNISYMIAPNEVGVMRLLIKGELANTELTPMVIPELKAVVYNDEDMVIARKRIIVSQPKIEGNSVQEFFSSVVPAPERVSRVEVVFDE